MSELEIHKNELDQLCREMHVEKLYAFGSVLQPDFKTTSDIDFVVEINEADPLKRGSYLLELWNKLEELFHRKIDLLTPSSIKNPVLKKNIDRSKVLVYER